MRPEHVDLPFPNLHLQVLVRKASMMDSSFASFEASLDLQRSQRQFLKTAVARNLRRVLFRRRNQCRGLSDFVTCELVVHWLQSQFGRKESRSRLVSIFFVCAHIIVSSHLPMPYLENRSSEFFSLKTHLITKVQRTL